MARIANIFLDTASARPSRQHFKSCGTKLQLERQPAIRPMIVGREVAKMPIFTVTGDRGIAQFQHENGPALHACIHDAYNARTAELGG